MANNLNDWFVREILVHESSLRRLIGRRVAASQVEDVLQQVFVNVLEAPMRDPIDNPRAYASRVACNLLNDLARRDKHCMVSLHDEALSHDPPDALVEDVTPERWVSGQKEVARLKTCLGKLSNRCREAVSLHKIRGLSVKETARLMGNTEKTVEQQLVVGMRKLTRCFNSDDPKAEPVTSTLIGVKIGTEHGH